MTNFQVGDIVTYYHPSVQGHTGLIVAVSQAVSVKSKSAIGDERGWPVSKDPTALYHVLWNVTPMYLTAFVDKEVNRKLTKFIPGSFLLPLGAPEETR